MRRPANILIDAVLCKQCGICVALCPKNNFDVAPDGLPLYARSEDCNGCRSCEFHCPDFAIQMVYAADDGDPAEQGVV